MQPKNVIGAIRHALWTRYSAARSVRLMTAEERSACGVAADEPYGSSCEDSGEAQKQNG